MSSAATLIACFLCGLMSGTQETKPLQGKELVAALQKGGYVIFIRHTQTDPTQADTDTLNLENTKAQRQLTAAGREQAKALGEAFRALRIPIGNVYTSQYYRTMEVARLAKFGNSQPNADITEPQNQPPVESQRRAKALRKLLATAPPEGKNTILISHRPNLQDAAGKEFGDLAEGEAVIFQPLGDKGFQMVARVPVDQWTKWATGK
jgi:phosphohistidine phosphatase SixA